MDYKNMLPSGCPDEKVSDIEGDNAYFRVTKNSPPISEDFIPLWFEKEIEPECLAKGISVSENIDDAKMLMKSFKNMGSYIYRGIIRYKIDGIVKLTPSRRNPSHRTWYPYEDTQEEVIFLEEIK